MRANTGTRSSGLHVTGGPPSRERVLIPPETLTTARHFARHRSFYRAMLTGPCGYRLNVALSEALGPFNRKLVERVPGIGPGVVDDLTAFVTGGWAAVFNTWVVDGPEPLDPDAFTDRLMALLDAVKNIGRVPAATQDEESRR